MRDDVPLPRAGVLRFVDQHMVDAAVELVMHPAGRDAVEHVERPVDQVVIVEQAALALFAPVVRRGRGRDVQQRLGAVSGRHRPAAFDQGADAEGFGLEQAADDRIVVDEFFRHHRLARRTVGLGEEHAEIGLDLCGAGEYQGFAQPAGVVLIGFIAGIQNGGDFLPARSRQVRSVDDVALDVLDAIVGIDAERRGNLRGCRVCAAGGVGPGHEVIAAQAGLAHHILERHIGRTRHRRHQRMPRGAVGIARCLEKYPEIGVFHHLGLVAVVEHGEACRHIGLERKLLQQPRAQRVDGLHLQPAGRFQRACKQLARRFPQPGVGMRNSGLTDRGIELSVVERDPMAKRGKYPFRHVGGGGLGEGDAEDLFRRHVLEQQPDHALHQHMRLAGAGIRGDECRRRRIGRPRLGGANGVGNDAGGLHHSSIPRPPAADHSLIRARSS